MSCVVRRLYAIVGVGVGGTPRILIPQWNCEGSSAGLCACSAVFPASGVKGQGG